MLSTENSQGTATLEFRSLGSSSRDKSGITMVESEYPKKGLEGRFGMPLICRSLARSLPSQQCTSKPLLVLFLSSRLQRGPTVSNVEYYAVANVDRHPSPIPPRDTTPPDHTPVFYNNAAAPKTAPASAPIPAASGFTSPAAPLSITELAAALALDKTELALEVALDKTELALERSLAAALVALEITLASVAVFRTELADAVALEATELALEMSLASTLAAELRTLEMLERDLLERWESAVTVRGVVVARRRSGRSEKDRIILILTCCLAAWM